MCCYANIGYNKAIPGCATKFPCEFLPSILPTITFLGSSLGILHVWETMYSNTMCSHNDLLAPNSTLTLFHS